MRKKSVLLFLVLSIALLCSCGDAETPESDDPAMTEQQPDVNVAQGDGSEAAGGADEDAEQGTSDENAVGESDAQDQDAAGLTPLSEEEIQFFTDLIQKMENYGFLLSAYDTPEDVDLGEVFYSGAGIDEAMSDEEIEAYLTERQQEEIYTDCVKVSRERIDAFLRAKLGIGLEEIRTPFPWFYLSEFDSYYHEAGDTNYTPYDCVEGVREGDLYTLRFHTDWFWEDLRSDCETVIRKSGEEYQFVSNRYLDGSEIGYGTGDSEVRAAYAAALQNLLENMIMPDGTEVELDPFWENRPNENEFCIADVDGDGTEELIIALTTTYMADMREEVYEYDPVTQKMRKELQEFPYVTYLDNGMIFSWWSHNDSYGEDFWPYNIYRYDRVSDEYLYMGCVTGWQKEFQPEGYPDDVDVSGTGTVYSITYGEEYTGEYDQLQYDQFYEEIIGMANELELQWYQITEEDLNILFADL
ncbi:MAG: hypothetical protein HDQ98_11995 [Lachnospiraceae bacterium]|nr:hypothetical protein [Lachnospiraceae bacterium]